MEPGLFEVFAKLVPSAFAGDNPRVLEGSFFKAVTTPKFLVDPLAEEASVLIALGALAKGFTPGFFTFDFATGTLVVDAAADFAEDFPFTLRVVFLAAFAEDFAEAGFKGILGFDWLVLRPLLLSFEGFFFDTFATE